MAKKKRSKFKGKTTANAHRQQQKGSKTNHLRIPKGVEVFEAAPGSRMLMDVMPYIVTDGKHPDRDDELEIAVPGELWYKRPYKVHRIQIGEDSSFINCPTSIGKKCPICEYRAGLLEKGASWDDDEVKEISAKTRNLYIIKPLKSSDNTKEYKDLEDSFHVWDISQHLFQKQLNEELETDEDNGVFPDLEEGLSLRIRFSAEKYKKYEFASTSRIDFEKRDKQYSDEVSNDVPNLDEMLIIYPYEVIHAKFFALEEEPHATDRPEEEEEEEQKPDPKERTRKTTKPEKEPEKPADEDDDTCIACEGTGVNSKGNECRICHGEGVMPSKEEKKTPPKEQAKKTPEPVKEKAAAKKETDGACPSGFTFGTDCEEKDECNGCNLWSECMDEKDRLEKEE